MAGEDAHREAGAVGLLKRLESEIGLQLGRSTALIHPERGKFADDAAWRSAMRVAMDASSFLVPVVSPAFIRSPWCAREVSEFLKRERQLQQQYPALGAESLIFPIYLHDIDREEPFDDDILRELEGRPSLDWRRESPVDPDDGILRQGVDRLSRLIASRLLRGPYAPPVEPSSAGVGGGGYFPPSRAGVGGGGYDEPPGRRFSTRISDLGRPPEAARPPVPSYVPAAAPPPEPVACSAPNEPAAEARPGFFGRIGRLFGGKRDGRSRSAAPGSSLSEVDFTVFAPPSLSPGQNFAVDLWLSAPGDREQMLTEATRGGLSERASRTNLRLETGTLVTARLSIPGFTIDEPVQNVGWAGEIANAAFIVDAPSSLSPGGHTGTIRLERRGIPFATLTFALRASSGASAAGPPPLLPVETQTQHIRRAFASYASADRPEVLRRVQGMAAIGVKVFLDVTRLRAGDDWQSRLFGEIDRSDRLFLFWSSKAARSDFVDREWRYALHRHGADFIEPVPLEDPRHAVPPQELAGKHFNDIYLAFIAAEEAQRPRAH